MEEPLLVLERGVKEVDIDVNVEDVYCMQDKYELPYTTVDGKGNTVVSVVEKVETYFPNQDQMRAKLSLKIFKNSTIKVVPVPIDGKEDCPRGSGFLGATLNSLEHNMKTDRYMKSIYNDLSRNYIRESNEATTHTGSPISGLRYSVYDDDNDITTTATATTATTYLKPYWGTRKALCSSVSSYIYDKWTTATSSTFAHHMAYWEGRELAHPIINAVERMKELLHSRQAPIAIIKNTSLKPSKDIKETRARQTLRRLIGNSAFQKYIVRGFVTFKGDSNRTYQIFPGHQKVAVWQQGKQIEQLCVILTGDFPPTDSVIMRLLLVQQSEDRFKSLANVFKPAYAPGLNRAAHIEVDNQRLSLPEIFSDLKVKQELSLQQLVA